MTLKHILNTSCKINSGYPLCTIVEFHLLIDVGKIPTVLVCKYACYISNIEEFQHNDKEQKDQ